MIERDLKDITESDLNNLKANSVREGKTIEYKAEVNLSGSDQIRKFLASIASFANASGGDLVFGIEALDGEPVALRPLTGFNPDQDVLRMRDLMNAHIEPKVFTVDFKPVDLSGGGFALVVRVRKTWTGAHMVTFNNDSRFYTRDQGGRRTMDVSEVRSAFTFAESLMERVNRLRLERLANITAEETPCPLLGKSCLVVHLIPLRSLAPGFQANLSALVHKTELLRPIASNSWGLAYDFDGVFVRGGSSNERAGGYIYVLKNGIIEVVDNLLLRGTQNNETYIPSIAWEQELLARLPNWFSALKQIGADPPVFVMLSLLGVRGYFMWVGPNIARGQRISRDQLLVPGILVESLDVQASDRSTKHNAVDIMRPLFDAVWHACGFSHSHNFYGDGSWGARGD